MVNNSCHFSFSKVRTTLQAAAIVALCGLLSACTFTEKKVEPRPARSRPLATSPSKVTVTDRTDVEASTSSDTAAARIPAPLDDVEVLWEIPSEPVEGFIIRYGTTEAQLDHESRVLFSEVEQVEEPGRGLILRYVLKQLPRDLPVFITIAAFSADHVSSPSTVITVPPATTLTPS